MTNNHVWTGPTEAAEGMPEELIALAETLEEWPDNEIAVSVVLHDKGRVVAFDWRYDGDYGKSQWLQARQDLGLVMSDGEEDMPAEEWEGRVPGGIKAPLGGMTASKYNSYFKDVRHIDAIDVYRVVGLFGCEKHGHPISHAAKKLLLSGCRTGGKDVEDDVREAIDTLRRWLEIREEDRGKM